MNKDSYKAKVLDRYCNKFQPAENEDEANVVKSSEDIMMDLRPIMDIGINEITEYLVENQYSLGFEEDAPVWLMKQ